MLFVRGDTLETCNIRPAISLLLDLYEPQQKHTILVLTLMVLSVVINTLLFTS